MFSDNDSRIILASWLHGEHLEDVNVISFDNFSDDYVDMANMIRKYGVDYKRLYEKFKPSRVSDVMSDYAPTLYQVAVQEVIKDQMMKRLPADPTPEQLMEYARKFQRNWMSMPKATDLASSYLDELGDRQKQKQIQTGIAVLDKLTYGIHKGQLTVIGARPSVGKSAFTLQVAYNVARKGNKVLFMPLEMTANELMDRLVLRFGSGLTSEVLRKGVPDAEQMGKINEVIDAVDKLGDNFKVFENVRDLDLIAQVIENEKPDLVVIDQLSQIKIPNAKSTIRERYVEVTRSLKALALEEDVAIWLPCQMNRNSSKNDIVTLDNLKESGSIEEDADVAILLSNTELNGSNVNENNERYVNVDVAKNRQGACGNEILTFNGPRFLFKSRAPQGFAPYNEKEKIDD